MTQIKRLFLLMLVMLTLAACASDGESILTPQYYDPAPVRSNR